MENHKYQNRWSMHREPIRPTNFFLEMIKGIAKETSLKNVMILGSTPEFIDLFAILGCKRIVSVDLNEENHRSMRRLCKQQSYASLIFENKNWLDQSEILTDQYDLVVGDLTHYFLSYPVEWNVSLKIIAKSLKPNGVFLSRQICVPDSYNVSDFEDLIRDIKLQIIEHNDKTEKVLQLLSQYKSIIPIICTENKSSILDVERCASMTKDIMSFAMQNITSQVYVEIASLFGAPPEIDGVPIRPKSVPEFVDVLQIYRNNFEEVEVQIDRSVRSCLSECFPCIFARVLGGYNG